MTFRRHRDSETKGDTGAFSDSDSESSPAKSLAEIQETSPHLKKLLANENAEFQDGHFVYLRKRALTGRGQPGRAGFYYRRTLDEEKAKNPDYVKYKDDEPLYLIKEDNLQTCIMEGSTGFVRNYLPHEHIDCINLAECRTLTIVSGKEAGEQTTVTMQKAIQGARGLDIPLYKDTFLGFFTGGKRIPWLMISQEELNKPGIQAYLNQMDDNLKADLAVSIFASDILGDESLHTGQFMETPDHIIRIDLGARERYALKRLVEDDFKTTTSESYSSSGQLGKTYKEFLLSDTAIRAKYEQLYVVFLQHFESALGKESVKSLENAVKQIPEDKKQNALWHIYKKILAKDCSPEILEKLSQILKIDFTKITSKTDQNQLLSIIKNIIKHTVDMRVSHLRAHALHAVNELMHEFNTNARKSSLSSNPLGSEQLTKTDIDAINDVLLTSHSDAKEMNNMLSTMPKIIMLCQDAGSKNLELYYNIIAHALAAVEFQPAPKDASASVYEAFIEHKDIWLIQMRNTQYFMQLIISTNKLYETLLKSKHKDCPKIKDMLDKMPSVFAGQLEKRINTAAIEKLLDALTSSDDQIAEFKKTALSLVEKIEPPLGLPAKKLGK